MSGKLLFSAMIGLSGALACSCGGSSGAYKPAPQPVQSGTLQVFGGGSERLSDRFYAGRNAYRSWCPDTSGRASADRILFSNAMTAQRIGNTWFFSDGSTAPDGYLDIRRNRRRNTWFFSDGSTAQQIGNFTFFGDGTTATHLGPFTLFSDGTTATHLGPFTLFSDGTTATHIGNFTFFSDGSTAHRMGNVLFYND